MKHFTVNLLPVIFIGNTKLQFISTAFYSYCQANISVFLQCGLDKSSGVSCKFHMKRFWDMTGTYKMIKTCGLERFASTVSKLAPFTGQATGAAWHRRTISLPPLITLNIVYCSIIFNFPLIFQFYMLMNFSYLNFAPQNFNTQILPFKLMLTLQVHVQTWTRLVFQFHVNLS